MINVDSGENIETCTLTPLTPSPRPPSPKSQLAIGKIEIANLQDDRTQLLGTTINTLGLLFNALDPSVYIVDSALLKVGSKNGSLSLQSRRESRLYAIAKKYICNEATQSYKLFSYPRILSMEKVRAKAPITGFSPGLIWLSEQYTLQIRRQDGV